MAPQELKELRRAAGVSQDGLARKLGMSWVANPVAALSRPYDGRPGCNYCAGCARGCPRRGCASAVAVTLASAKRPTTPPKPPTCTG